jgi:hypothetical protein
LGLWFLGGGCCGGGGGKEAEPKTPSPTQRGVGGAPQAEADFIVEHGSTYTFLVDQDTPPLVKAAVFPEFCQVVASALHDSAFLGLAAPVSKPAPAKVAPPVVVRAGKTKVRAAPATPTPAAKPSSPPTAAQVEARRARKRAKETRRRARRSERRLKAAVEAAKLKAEALTAERQLAEAEIGWTRVERRKKRVLSSRPRRPSSRPGPRTPRAKPKETPLPGVREASRLTSKT